MDRDYSESSFGSRDVHDFTEKAEERWADLRRRLIDTGDPELAREADVLVSTLVGRLKGTIETVEIVATAFAGAPITARRGAVGARPV